MADHDPPPTTHDLMTKHTQMPMGVDGFSYADLHVPERLRDLYDVFCREVAAADPSFWAEWDAYRSTPDAGPSPIAQSDLIVRMAPHVSRFVTRLFTVGQVGPSDRGAGSRTGRRSVRP